MTAAVIELSLDLASDGGSGVGSREEITFTAQQGKFLDEALDWLANPQKHPRLMALHGFAGAGKRQPLTEPILTPEGWRVMGDIGVGSYVIGADGYPAKVTNVYHGTNKTYKVTFCDGTFAYCCDEHLWKVQSPKQRQRGTYSIKTLGEMLPKIDEPLIGSRGYWYSIPLCKPVQFEEKDLSLDPYLLGWLLAEAYMGGKQIQTTVHVDEIDDIDAELTPLLPDGVRFVKGKCYQGNAQQVRFTFGLQSHLESLGLMGKLSTNKFIPKSYLLGSEQQRRALLAGLMDGDGTTQRFASGKVKTAFHSSSEEMARGVAELVRSLGGYSIVRKENDRGKGEEWRVSIRLWFNPFRLPYKRDIYGNYVPKARKIKKIVSAEYVGEMPGQCITVENEDRLYLTRDYIVTHNTFVVNHLLSMARQQNILVGDVWATAPTHQAKKVLEKASKGTGAGISDFLTSHSFFGLRPQYVEFDEAHEAKLEELLAIEEKYRTPDQCTTIETLLWRRGAAAERVQEFLPTKIKKGSENVRLVVADEFSMMPEVLARLYFELPFIYDTHPDLQILFLGDPAQLPPIDEEESLVCSIPKFTPLTEVVRNKGAILEYCTAIRTAVFTVKDGQKIGYSSTEDAAKALGVDEIVLVAAMMQGKELNGWKIEKGTPIESLPMLHYQYESQGDDNDLLIMSQQDVLRAIKDVVESGDSVRFLAGTNARCLEINTLVRYALKGFEEGLKYYPGDVVLTLSAVKRGMSYAYGVNCDGEEVQDHTSTLMELGDELHVGDYVSCGKGGIRLTEKSFAFTSVLGTTFHRRFFRHRPYDSGEKFGLNQALALIEPKEYEKWLEECDFLRTRARSTSVKGKDARGQNGDTAKAVWAEFGLKNWHKKLDGTALSNSAYKKIHNQLWIDYFQVSQFSDKVSFSYCSTIHRGQGISTKIAIVDEKTVMKSQMGKYSKKFCPRKLIYTAASRASEQLIIMQ
jgi:hypothetical protein